jgi:hypothetical protein
MAAYGLLGAYSSSISPSAGCFAGRSVPVSLSGPDAVLFSDAVR